jgi:predicted nucleic acid-binding protein
VRVVLDASAAVEIALNRKKGTHLAAILDQAEQTLAPDLLFPEVVNAIWKEHQIGGLSLSICDAALSVLPGLVDTLVSSRDIYRQAFLLSRTARRPAYDMFYLALARREDAALLTLDAALKREALREGIQLA